jgi:hypothetical protein
MHPIIIAFLVWLFFVILLNLMISVYIKVKNLSPRESVEIGSFSGNSSDYRFIAFFWPFGLIAEIIHFSWKSLVNFLARFF